MLMLMIFLLREQEMEISLEMIRKPFRVETAYLVKEKEIKLKTLKNKLSEKQK